jgi:hypothetical protein
MRRVLALLRFFQIVTPVPRLMLATFAVVAVAGGILVALRPERAAAALSPVLLLQLFAASSGFSVPARRGHYDLLLTMGESRWRIAAAHWLTSILPGTAGWLTLAITEMVTTRGARASLLASGSVAALALVSTLPWAMTVSLPRFAAAIGWLLLLALVAMSLAAERTIQLFGALAGGQSWVETVVALLLYPPVLVGESIAGPQGLIVVPALLVAAAAMGQAFAWIARSDIPLEAAQ